MSTISIITPVYSGARFIEACIQVVIDQHCAEAEHLIVDGGSTDGTVEIIRRYAAQYPHIRWVSEQDRGQSDAMNKGLALARGEVIGFLNVDDYYEPHVLSRVLGIFKTLPELSLLVGNCNVWGDDDILLHVNRPTKLRLADLLLGYHVNHIPINPSAYFYHALLHSQIGPYDVEEHYVLDWDFLLRAVQVAKVKYVDEVWGNYRLITGTKTANSIQSGQDILRFNRLVQRYRKDLPRLQRWLVTIQHRFYETKIGNTFNYFRSRPGELLPRLKRRVGRRINLTRED